MMKFPEVKKSRVEDSLRDIYGYCIIPKNTLLFRGHSDTSIDDCMFFVTKKWVAGAFNENIQIWKTTKDIEILFLVEHLTYNSWTISALPRLYNNIFPTDSNANFDDLDIKHWDITRRNKFVRNLYDEYRISGWLTSLENKVELEVCLFDKHANAGQIFLVGTTHSNDQKYFKDSLDSLRILPAKIFYEETNKKLSEQEPLFTDEKDHYKRYKKMQDAWVREDVQNCHYKVESKHFHLSLRTKLKI
jgi:hypothetical protein